MKIIILLFILSCIYTLSRYGMKDIVFRNSGRNVKPIQTSYFDKAKERLKDIDKKLYIVIKKK